ncbi:hypothetical protein ACHWQZ_G007398 [Mnemiopsis leidyi]
MCRAVSQWRGVVVLARRFSGNAPYSQSARCLSTFTRISPFLQPRSQCAVTQQYRNAYNPFHPIGGSADIPHDHETDEKPNRQQKRQDKRRKLQQSSHSTHSHFDELEGDDTDSVLFNDVRIVGWSPEEIYAVVMNVAEYKEFIPYCIKSTVFTQHSTKRHDYMEAELKVGFQLYQLSYTSKVDGSTTLDGKKIVTAVCENKKLFDHLNMEWTIGPGPKEHTSVMDFNVSFRFSNKLYNSVASMFKSSVVDQMIPAFESRLRDIHGEPTILSSLSATAGKVHRRKRRR